MSGDYVVGYGKPPVNGRFQKGRSGNPGGKPGPEKTKRYEFAQMLNAGMSESTELVATTPCTSIWAATAKGILLDGVRGKIPAIRLSFSLLDELDGVPTRKRRGIDAMLAEVRAADDAAEPLRNEQETQFPAQGIIEEKSVPAWCEFARGAVHNEANAETQAGDAGRPAGAHSAQAGPGRGFPGSGK